MSDTHLSHVRAYAVPNVRAVLDVAGRRPADLVVHTGDLTADDPDDAREADFAHAL
jgi:predicted phosphodiesterase